MKINHRKTFKRSLSLPNFWVYILYCENDSFYTGYTTNLCQRFSDHVNGVAAKYTRSFRPRFVVSAWPIYSTKSDAMRVERFIKKMDRNFKEKLINHPISLEQLFIEKQSG